MPNDPTRVRVELEIPFQDVDSYRVVWHGNYPRYFEIARCKLLEQLTIPYSVLESIGFFYPVIELDVKYLKPLHFCQKIIVEAKLVEFRNKLVVRYTIRDAVSEEIITKAKTAQVAVSPDGAIQYEAPPAVIAAVEKVLATC